MTRSSFFVQVLISVLLLSNFALFALELGDRVKPFQANDDEGNLWQSGAFLNKKILVVYFYPAAMTGGCTAQACAFRDHRTGLASMDVQVVGVSGDAVANLMAFKKVNRLNFTLLSDVNGVIASLFGVPMRKGGSIQKTIDGKAIELQRSFTFARWTFVLDKSGKVIYKNTDVQAQNNGEKIKMFIQNHLQSG